MGTVSGVVALALLSAGLAPEAGPASQDRTAAVTIALLPDGRCAVSSIGEGFRSNATYLPNGNLRAGARRCAMPPVNTGLSVALSVTLPAGAQKPGVSVPPLDWVRRDGRWIGSARLSNWPDAVMLAPAAPNWTAWTLLALVVVAMMVGIWRRTSRRRPATLRTAGVV